jgi:hypothetical protein
VLSRALQCDTLKAEKSAGNPALCVNCVDPS